MTEVEKTGEERRRRLRSPRAQAIRDLRIIEQLGAGVSIREIALREKVFHRAARP